MIPLGSTALLFTLIIVLKYHILCKYFVSAIFFNSAVVGIYSKRLFQAHCLSAMHVRYISKSCALLDSP